MLQITMYQESNLLPFKDEKKHEKENKNCITHNCNGITWKISNFDDITVISMSIYNIIYHNNDILNIQRKQYIVKHWKIKPQRWTWHKDDIL